MFDSIEIRRVENGFVLIIHAETTKEYIYDTERKLFRALKDLLGDQQ